MPDIDKKSFASPDKTSSMGEKIKVEFVTVGNVNLPRVTADPGWKWSQHSKPVFKTESCQKDHLLYMISGTVAAHMNGGKMLEFEPGEIGIIPPGHDGWTVGDEPAVWLEIPH